MILVPTADRVTDHSPKFANERIAASTAASVEYYRLHPEQTPSASRRLAASGMSSDAWRPVRRR